MNLKKEHVLFIDQLRKASREYGAVADLLMFLDAAIVIDDCGNRAIDGEKVDYLQAALVAAQFVMADRGIPEDETEE